MSTLAVDAIVDSNNGNTTTINGATPTAYNTMGKNRIINGAMEIDQRNAGASVAFTSNAYSLDRWVGAVGTASGTTIQRSTTSTAGFSNSALITIGTGASPAAGAVNRIYQVVEGYNIADLAWGTASAATVTLSFWVRSSVTGTFSGAMYGASTIQSYLFTYSISSANTWVQKTVTVTGPTTGTWDSTNGTGVYVNFDLGSGSTFKNTAGAWVTGTYIGATGATDLCTTSGATFYITGVQLEAGSVATEFERRPYGTELQLCQRYYYQTWGNGSFSNIGSGYVGQVLPSANNNSSYGSSNFPVSMRATPTVTLYDSLGSSGTVSQPAVANGLAAVAGNISVTGFYNVTKSSTTFTVGTPVICQYTAAIEL